MDSGLITIMLSGAVLFRKARYDASVEQRVLMVLSVMLRVEFGYEGSWKAAGRKAMAEVGG